MDKTLPDSEEPIVQAPNLGIKLPSDQPPQETIQPIDPTPVMPISNQSDSGYVPPTPTPFVQNTLPPDPFDSVYTEQSRSAQGKPFNSVPPIPAAQTPEQVYVQAASEPTVPQPTAFEPPLPPPPAPPTPIFENSASIKKGLPKMFLFAVIIAIIIGIAAAYYVSTAKTNNSAQQSDLTRKTPVTAPIETPPPTISPAETATPSPKIDQDLKTYISSVYGFELSYPATWRYSENFNEYKSIKFSDPNKSIPNSTIGDISITPYKTTLSLSAWIDSGHPVFGENLKEYYTVKQTITVNGNSVTEMTGGNDSTYGKVAYLKSGSYVYELFLQGTAASIKQDGMLNDDVFGKIISSLKFSL